MAKEYHRSVFAALCLSDISPLACPISINIDSFVLFSVQETLSIFLQIHVSWTIRSPYILRAISEAGLIYIFIYFMVFTSTKPLHNSRGIVSANFSYKVKVKDPGS